LTLSWPLEATEVARSVDTENHGEVERLSQHAPEIGVVVMPAVAKLLQSPPASPGPCCRLPPHQPQSRLCSPCRLSSSCGSCSRFLASSFSSLLLALAIIQRSSAAIIQSAGTPSSLSWPHEVPAVCHPPLIFFCIQSAFSKLLPPSILRRSGLHRISLRENSLKCLGMNSKSQASR